MAEDGGLFLSRRRRRERLAPRMCLSRATEATTTTKQRKRAINWSGVDEVRERVEQPRARQVDGSCSDRRTHSWNKERERQRWRCIK